MNTTDTPVASFGLLRIYWPLYSVFPACVVVFYLFYIFSEPLWHRYVKDYKTWTELNQRIWRQNICATAHSYLLTILLLIVVLRSYSQLQAAMLLPYYEPLAYGAVSVPPPFEMHMKLSDPSAALMHVLRR